MEGSCKRFLTEKMKLTEAQIDHVEKTFPFKTNNLCYFKVKGNKSDTCMISFALEEVDGVVYNWTIGQHVTGSIHVPKVFEDQNLPDAARTHNTYESCKKVGIWKNLNGDGMQYSTTDFSKGKVTYRLWYPGHKVRVFKYRNAVYMVTYQGENAKKAKFDKERTIWDAFTDTTGISPDEISPPILTVRPVMNT